MWRKRAVAGAGFPGAAAQRWHAGARVIAELGAWENAVYLIEAGPGVQVLRLVDAGRQPPGAVAAELDFVGHLVASGVPAARPLRSARGRLIEPVATAGGRTFLASAFEYLAGQELSAAQCREAPAAFWRSWGAAVARMHTAAARYTPPGPARARWDDDPLVRRHAEILAHAPAWIGAQFAETLAWLSVLPADSRMFGLVHADFHGRNFRYQDGEFRVFDFDDACYSWWAYDLAVGVAWAFDQFTAGPAMAAQDALLEGYHEVRPLTAGWERQLPAFVRLRRLLDYSYGLDNLAQDLVAPQDQQGYRAFLRQLADTLDDSTPTVQPLCRR